MPCTASIFGCSTAAAFWASLKSSASLPSSSRGNVVCGESSGLIWAFCAASTSDFFALFLLSISSIFAAER